MVLSGALCPKNYLGPSILQIPWFDVSLDVEESIFSRKNGLGAISRSADGIGVESK